MGRTLLKSIKVKDGFIMAMTASNNTYPRRYSQYKEPDTQENRALWKEEIEGAVVIPLASCERNAFIKSLQITHYWNGEPFNEENRKKWRYSSCV